MLSDSSSGVERLDGRADRHRKEAVGDDSEERRIQKLERWVRLAYSTSRSGGPRTFVDGWHITGRRRYGLVVEYGGAQG